MKRISIRSQFKSSRKRLQKIFEIAFYPFLYYISNIIQYYPTRGNTIGCLTGCSTGVSEGGSAGSEF